MKKTKRTKILKSGLVDPEPLLTDNCQLVEALNWYSNTQSRRSAKKYLLHWAKRRKNSSTQLLEFIKNIPEENLQVTLCWLMRIYHRAPVKMLGKYQSQIDSYFNSLQKLAKGYNPKIKLLTIDDLLSLEEKFVTTKKCPVVKMQNIKLEDSDEVITYIDNQLHDYKLSFKDKDFNDAYFWATKKQRKEYIQLLSRLKECR